jgi:hypothetical protein
VVAGDSNIGSRQRTHCFEHPLLGFHQPLDHRLDLGRLLSGSQLLQRLRARGELRDKHIVFNR